MPKRPKINTYIGTSSVENTPYDAVVIPEEMGWLLQTWIKNLNWYPTLPQEQREMCMWGQLQLCINNYIEQRFKDYVNSGDRS